MFAIEYCSFRTNRVVYQLHIKPSQTQSRAGLCGSSPLMNLMNSTLIRLQKHAPIPRVLFASSSAHLCILGHPWRDRGLESLVALEACGIDRVRQHQQRHIASHLFSAIRLSRHRMTLC